MHGAIIGCATHGKTRTFKPKSTVPKNKCPVCWLTWLSDRMETMLYEDDMADLCKFANKMNVIQFTKIEFEEESKDDPE